MAVSNDAKIWAVIGASGQGKGVWIKQQLRAMAPPRLVAWDFMNEYGDFAAPVATLKGLQTAMLAAGAAGPLRMRYVPRGAGEKALRKEFETVCELVYAWGNCTFIAEELANVTTPGWAPGAWRKMTTSGRHAGIHIIGATQTPTLVDKTFLGNCSLVHVCALREAQHRVYVARSIDVTPELVGMLSKFLYLERDYDTGRLLMSRVDPIPPGVNQRDVDAKLQQLKDAGPVATATGTSTTARSKAKTLRNGAAGGKNGPSKQPTTP